MAPKTIEEKIDEMHETMVRLEPYLKVVDRLDKAVFNEGWGIAAKVNILCVMVPAAWAIFLIWLKNKI